MKFRKNWEINAHFLLRFSSFPCSVSVNCIKLCFCMFWYNFIFLIGLLSSICPPFELQSFPSSVGSELKGPHKQLLYLFIASCFVETLITLWLIFSTFIYGMLLPEKFFCYNLLYTLFPNCSFGIFVMPLFHWRKIFYIMIFRDYLTVSCMDVPCLI